MINDQFKRKSYHLQSLEDTVVKKIVVAMDSMKGCLGSLEASSAIAEGLKRSHTEVEVICVPVADGGEGTAVALSYGKGEFRRMISTVTGPLGNEIEAEWYMDSLSAIAFIDMASAAGLALIEESKRNPLHTTTYGVGQLIMEAVGNGASSMMLGLGGSATVDAGLGACQAMGLRLYDAQGRELPEPFVGAYLPKMADYQVSGFLKENRGVSLSLLCDVTAPFTGRKGAAHVFGPQKGASSEEVEFLEAGMENVRNIVLNKIGVDLNTLLGSGAAGGAAGGLLTFAGGKMEKGAKAILNIIDFDSMIEGADLIITGEGGSDRQTLMGKIPFEILNRGKRQGIPVWLVAGRVSDEEELMKAGFERIICVNSPEIIERSKTEDRNPLDPDVASSRLHEMFKHYLG